jgi:hypothetical protein
MTALLSVSATGLPGSFSAVVTPVRMRPWLRAGKVSEQRARSRWYELGRRTLPDLVTLKSRRAYAGVVRTGCRPATAVIPR